MGTEQNDNKPEEATLRGRTCTNMGVGPQSGPSDIYLGLGQWQRDMAALVRSLPPEDLDNDNMDEDSDRALADALADGKPTV
ncbi:MAG: hypothetical protein UV80_C0002G0001 [Candidatus Peregrinibacteria bacterium GW2011_GWF2_43_17]|nr:MAG: hypothetical protein UV80_C0002G0001 [Candidatus Peregrinibacteria bacterium GW2011_GWF2_43_17]HAU39953.1 hypothetical protein [Candidatus Peregrinibacteria bacterium]